MEDQIDNSITLTAFADDHSIHNNFKAGDMEQEHNVKTYPEIYIQTSKTMDGYDVPQAKP